MMKKRLVAEDRESSQRDLYESIERRFPALDLLRADNAGSRSQPGPLQPFDLTKIWPYGDYPLIEVGYWNLTATRITTSLRLSRSR